MISVLRFSLEEWQGGHLLVNAEVESSKFLMSRIHKIFIFRRHCTGMASLCLDRFNFDTLILYYFYTFIYAQYFI